MVKLIALKEHPPFGKRIRFGETYEVDETNARLMQKLGWAAIAPEGSPEPVFVHGQLKRRDVPASPARVDMRAEPPRAAPSPVGAMGGASRLSSAPIEETSPPPKRGRGRPRKPRAEEGGDEGEPE